MSITGVEPSWVGVSREALHLDAFDRRPELVRRGVDRRMISHRGSGRSFHRVAATAAQRITHVLRLTGPRQLVLTLSPPTTRVPLDDPEPRHRLAVLRTLISPHDADLSSRPSALVADELRAVWRSAPSPMTNSSISAPSCASALRTANGTSAACSCVGMRIVASVTLSTSRGLYVQTFRSRTLSSSSTTTPSARVAEV